MVVMEMEMERSVVGYVGLVTYEYMKGNHIQIKFYL